MVISSRTTGADIGMLIPTPEGFRLYFSDDLEAADPGGGLIIVWNRDPTALRFDVVTTSQGELPMSGGQP